MQLSCGSSFSLNKMVSEVTRSENVPAIDSPQIHSNILSLSNMTGYSKLQSGSCDTDSSDEKERKQYRHFTKRSDETVVQHMSL